MLPALVELGVVRFARLEADQALNQMLIGNLCQDATPDQPFKTRTFSDVQQARTWACSLTPPPQIA